MRLLRQKRLQDLALSSWEIHRREGNEYFQYFWGGGGEEGHSVIPHRSLMLINLGARKALFACDILLLFIQT